MTDSGLLVSHDGDVLRVTIDRPARLNALDARTSAAVTEVFRSAATDARVVILTGTGAAFSAGADIIDMAAADPADPVAAAEDTMRRANDLISAIISCPVPVIAQVAGPAVGIGASMALASDLIYASEDAYFLLAFTAIGLMPDGGSSLLIPAAIGRARASAMLLLAERMHAPEALTSGLINDVLPADRLGSYVDAVAKKLARAPKRALELAKKSLTGSTLSLLDDALRRESEGQIELLTSPEFVSRAAAFASSQKGA